MDSSPLFALAGAQLPSETAEVKKQLLSALAQLENPLHLKIIQDALQGTLASLPGNFCAVEGSTNKLETSLTDREGIPPSQAVGAPTMHGEEANPSPGLAQDPAVLHSASNHLPAELEGQEQAISAAMHDDTALTAECDLPLDPEVIRGGFQALNDMIEGGKFEPSAATVAPALPGLGNKLTVSLYPSLFFLSPTKEEPLDQVEDAALLQIPSPHVKEEPAETAGGLREADRGEIFASCVTQGESAGNTSRGADTTLPVEYPAPVTDQLLQEYSASLIEPACNLRVQHDGETYASTSNAEEDSSLEAVLAAFAALGASGLPCIVQALNFEELFYKGMCGEVCLATLYRQKLLDVVKEAGISFEDLQKLGFPLEIPALHPLPNRALHWFLGKIFPDGRHVESVDVRVLFVG